MGDKELHEKALQHIWGWASNMHEGIENNELSGFFQDEVAISPLTEKEAHICQKWMKHEAEIIWRKSIRIKKKT